MLKPNIHIQRKTTEIQKSACITKQNIYYYSCISFIRKFFEASPKLKIKLGFGNALNVKFSSLYKTFHITLSSFTLLHQTEILGKQPGLMILTNVKVNYKVITIFSVF